MLNSQLMNQLSAIQSAYSVAKAAKYQTSVMAMGCGNGPTSCQNQW